MSLLLLFLPLLTISGKLYGQHTFKFDNLPNQPSYNTTFEIDQDKQIIKISLECPPLPKYCAIGFGGIPNKMENTYAIIFDKLINRREERLGNNKLLNAITPKNIINIISDMTLNNVRYIVFERPLMYIFNNNDINRNPYYQFSIQAKMENIKFVVGNIDENGKFMYHGFNGVKYVTIPFNFVCPKDEIPCLGDDVIEQCIPSEWICDFPAQADCINGYDEKNCTYDETIINGNGFEYAPYAFSPISPAAPIFNAPPAYFANLLNNNNIPTIINPTSKQPTIHPTINPTTFPTMIPTNIPTTTMQPTLFPTKIPVMKPQTSKIIEMPTWPTRRPTRRRWWTVKKGRKRKKKKTTTTTLDPTSNPVYIMKTTENKVNVETISPSLPIFKPIIIDNDARQGSIPTTPPSEYTDAPTSSICLSGELITRLDNDYISWYIEINGPKTDKNEIYIQIDGPNNKWFGIGFNSHTMYKTYSIIVFPNAIIQERYLSFQSKGELLTHESIKLISYKIYNNRQIIKLKRSQIGYNGKYYTFPNKPKNITMIYAQQNNINNNIQFGYHGDNNRGINGIEFIYNNCKQPTFNPTKIPSINPTNNPSINPTLIPTDIPSINPSDIPTKIPSISPTIEPTLIPTNLPSLNPTTINPTNKPSINPTDIPTNIPTLIPTKIPSINPTTMIPTYVPSINPSESPTMEPTIIISDNPSINPTKLLTLNPSSIKLSTIEPTAVLLNTVNPTYKRVRNTNNPTNIPTLEPTLEPTKQPSNIPTLEPTFEPSINPTIIPTLYPSLLPSILPTFEPTTEPSKEPTIYPTDIPSIYPSNNPTMNPTQIPSIYPTNNPSDMPSMNPTQIPSMYPTNNPTINPSKIPSIYPTYNPISLNPTIIPSINPTTNNPTNIPTNLPIINNKCPKLIPHPIHKNCDNICEKNSEWSIKYIDHIYNVIENITTYVYSINIKNNLPDNYCFHDISKPISINWIELWQPTCCENSCKSHEIIIKPLNKNIIMEKIIRYHATNTKKQQIYGYKFSNLSINNNETYLLKFNILGFNEPIYTTNNNLYYGIYFIGNNNYNNIKHCTYGNNILLPNGCGNCGKYNNYITRQPTYIKKENNNNNDYITTKYPTRRVWWNIGSVNIKPTKIPVNKHCMSRDINMVCNGGLCNDYTKTEFDSNLIDVRQNYYMNYTQFIYQINILDDPYKEIGYNWCKLNKFEGPSSLIMYHLRLGTCCNIESNKLKILTNSILINNKILNNNNILYKNGWMLNINIKPDTIVNITLNINGILLYNNGDWLGYANDNRCTYYNINVPDLCNLINTKNMDTILINGNITINKIYPANDNVISLSNSHLCNAIIHELGLFGKISGCLPNQRGYTSEDGHTKQRGLLTNINDNISLKIKLKNVNDYYLTKLKYKNIKNINKKIENHYNINNNKHKIIINNLKLF